MAVKAIVVDDENVQHLVIRPHAHPGWSEARLVQSGLARR